MKKVTLKLNEEKKYQLIKKLVETTGNKQRAALKLGCTIRTVNRLIVGYNNEGKAFFVHGNHLRKPAHALSEELKKTVVTLYLDKYKEANFTHFSELLEENEGIRLSTTTLSAILKKERILSPKATRRTKKNMKIIWKKEQMETTKKSEGIAIQQAILSVEEAHPRRPRAAYAGELIQMDASVHLWFGETKTQLHIAIDDATGQIVGAYFDYQETLNGYYHVLHAILQQHGIPAVFLTDNRTVFEYKQKKAPSIEEDTFTQFGCACHQLGIAIRTSSVPQAKGRVERVFQTLQSRLPVVLRLADCQTIQHANEFLNSYIKEFNAQFALPLESSKSVFERQPSQEKVNLILAVLSERKIDAGHCIAFQKKYYQLIDQRNQPVYFPRGVTGVVIQAFDKQLFFCVNETVYALDEVPKRAKISKNFDEYPSDRRPKKRYTPPMSHPWKHATFQAHLKKQVHRSTVSV